MMIVNFVLAALAGYGMAALLFDVAKHVEGRLRVRLYPAATSCFECPECNQRVAIIWEPGQTSVEFAHAGCNARGRVLRKREGVSVS